MGLRPAHLLYDQKSADFINAMNKERTFQRLDQYQVYCAWHSLCASEALAIKRSLSRCVKPVQHLRRC